MAKIVLESIITSKDGKKHIKEHGVLKDNLIAYNEDNTKVQIKILDDGIYLKRENDEYLFDIMFKKDLVYDSKYHLKKLNTYIDLKVITNTIEKHDKKYIIDYELFMSGISNGTFKYELKWSDLS